MIRPAAVRGFHFAALVSTFLFVFTVEIQVKAETLSPVSAKKLLQVPAGCWAEEEGACAVRTRRGERVELEWAQGHLNLDQSTAMVRLAPNEIRLISGLLFIQADAKADTVVRSEFGTVIVPAGARGLLQKESGRLLASSMGGEWILKPRGSSEVLGIPVGLQNSIGRVQSDGRAEVGMPTALAWVPSIKAWGRVYSGNLKEFTEEVEALEPIWNQAAEEASELHHGLYSRRVASLNAADQHRAELLKRTRAHDRELVEKFRRKVFDE